MPGRTARSRRPRLCEHLPVGRAEEGWRGRLSAPLPSGAQAGSIAAITFIGDVML